MDLLGPGLKALDVLRMEYKVWIEWDHAARSLKVSSRSATRGIYHVAAALKGIRNTVQHAEASTLLATPIYFVVPPDASVITKIVRPKTVHAGVKYATDIELAGERYSEDEKVAWNITRGTILQKNRQRLEKELVDKMLELAPYKGSMLFRIRFGRVVFEEYRKEFGESKFNFDRFKHMMGLARTTARLEPK